MQELQSIDHLSLFLSSREWITEDQADGSMGESFRKDFRRQTPKLFEFRIEIDENMVEVKLR